MTKEEIEKHSLAILGSARVRNKYVFLCEGDLIDNLSIAIDRLNVDGRTLEDIKKLFCDKLNEKSIKMLFSIRKVKPYWKRISTDDSIDNERLKEQLELAIANQISINNDYNCHITAIFNKIILNKSGI
ncbi:MAG: hypothetical protein QM493_08120 [Sulfurovum sp.]